MHLPFPSSAGSAPQGSCVDPRPTSNPASPFTPLLQGRTHLTTHLKTASKKPPRHRKQLVPWGGNSGRTGCRSAGVAWGRWGPAGLPWILSADCLGGGCQGWLEANPQSRAQWPCLQWLHRALLLRSFLPHWVSTCLSSLLSPVPRPGVFPQIWLWLTPSLP